MAVEAATGNSEQNKVTSGVVARVKICGITCLEDALLAIDAGADALGFVFYAPSPRYVSPDVAAEIIRELPPFVTTVALFVDAPVAEIQSVITLTQIDLLQFHGKETADYCEQFSRPYFKALRMSADLDVSATAAEYSSARAILLDAYRKGVPGGTGESFDWQRIPSDLSKPLILAGGLDESNIYRAITEVSPFAVDVSGGVERIKGRKSPEKINTFMSEVARANYS
ncbi:phosphoribosylanthranilate isomerase [Aliamphritea ceti]|uniref:phosphoribosylanthranilate isomerase n=1 Tax=Aliamphritea ceti TaxID=1524258 RepID=UPI0021C4982D|nr:phosphoribosylanthranilate isomerase [Aliamphritea ceti]